MQVSNIEIQNSSEMIQDVAPIADATESTTIRHTDLQYAGGGTAYCNW